MKVNVQEFYHGKKVFITGHTGFKGAWLAYWLTQLGASVTGYALEPEYEGSLFDKLKLSNVINHYIGDVRDLDHLSSVMNGESPDIVFHLAAQALVRRSYDDPLLTFSTNVIGSLNLLESVRHCPSIRSLVYITSDKCYWNNEWVWGYRETDALGGPDPYSASKACAEHVFKSYYLSYFKNRENFGCGSTRAGNVIGGGDRAIDRIVPDIIRAAETGSPITLRNPQSTRPWQHVMDPLYGYLTIGMHLYHHPQKHNGEGWNFGPSNQSIKTVLELTKVLTSLWDNVHIETPAIQGQPHESNLLHLSIDKAQTLLKWEPRLHFHEAVTQTGEWYKRVENGDDPRDVTKKQIADFMNV
ncbi:MAG: CDP-glucose 4,6-dehydratase [Alphaproteobacteria bacterium]|nr:CDP-glucose 4,6-dehydratase [Alphaproteobacteria bacterium]MBX9976742.1 CDP-glucose 4,6-dehydratase [Alphaproteobacteria bacterium]